MAAGIFPYDQPYKPPERYLAWSWAYGPSSELAKESDMTGMTDLQMLLAVSMCCLAFAVFAATLVVGASMMASWYDEMSGRDE